MLKHLVVVLAALSLTLVAARAEAQARTAVVLRPGDMVQLNIWPDDQGYSGEYVVEDNGILVVPFLGEIQAAGVSVEQLRQTIREGYGQTRRELVVTIRPQFRVGVMGAVRNPSVYAVSPSQNIFDVIAMAGEQVGHIGTDFTGPDHDHVHDSIANSFCRKSRTCAPCSRSGRGDQ